MDNEKYLKGVLASLMDYYNLCDENESEDFWDFVNMSLKSVYLKAQVDYMDFQNMKGGKN